MRGGGTWTDIAADRVRRTLAPADLGDDVVVVAAHPDDETLAVGGLVQAVHAIGARVRLIVATDGEAAFPAAGPDTRAELARTRRTELRAALDVLGLEDVQPLWLGLPDSGLAPLTTELATRLAPELADATAVLAPWEHDPHPDHAAAGRAARAAAPVSAHVFGYPIWLWVWEDPAQRELPWDHAYVHAPDEDARRRKRAAVAAFASQLQPGPAGEDPILPPAVLDTLDTHREILFRIPPTAGAPVDRFADVYADGAPWDEDTWFEQRKRDVVLASLPRRHYRHAVEPGCGSGLLTAELASRCDRVDASDPVHGAVERARARIADPARTGADPAGAAAPRVAVRSAALPEPAALPSGADLVVLSEVLYYLSDADLSATVELLVRTAEPGADVVLVHWRGWPAEAPRDAATTHAVLLGDPRFEPLVEHVDEQFLLHVLRRR